MFRVLLIQFQMQIIKSQVKRWFTVSDTTVNSWHNQVKTVVINMHIKLSQIYIILCVRIHVIYIHAVFDELSLLDFFAGSSSWTVWPCNGGADDDCFVAVPDEISWPQSCKCLYNMVAMLYTKQCNVKWVFLIIIMCAWASWAIDQCQCVLGEDSDKVILIKWINMF